MKGADGKGGGADRRSPQPSRYKRGVTIAPRTGCKQGGLPVYWKQSRKGDVPIFIQQEIRGYSGITFHAALNGGRLFDNIEFNSSSSLGFRVGKQSSNLLRLFIWFDSIAFITSAASMIIILMHQIPLKAWMLISVFSLFGAYICSIVAVSPGDAWPVFLLGSPPIVLASMPKHLALLYGSEFTKA